MMHSDLTFEALFRPVPAGKCRRDPSPQISLKVPSRHLARPEGGLECARAPVADGHIDCLCADRWVSSTSTTSWHSARKPSAPSF